MDAPTLASTNLGAVGPALVVLFWATILLVIDLFWKDKKFTALLAVIGLAVAGGMLIMQTVAAQGQPVAAFYGMVMADGFALFLQGIFLLTAILSIALAVNFLPARGLQRGEYYTLLMFSTAGMMFMALANNLIVVFISLELLSIPLYVLTGFNRDNAQSEEAAMKYFLLGAFASGFLVYGIALTYGGTGTTDFGGILAALSGPAENLPLTLAGLGLIIVGLGFKVAAAPFHQWTPDVYQGAPTPVTAFMSVGAKAGGFAALLRVLLAAFPALGAEWGVILSVVALLTLVIGNVIAIAQTNIKRMLAYSSIAHAGYILIAVAAAQNPDVAPFAISAAVFYLLAYAFTNLGAFAVVEAVEHTEERDAELDDFAGLAQRRPALSAIMLLFMLSLTGLPPSAGMVGKVFIFQAALRAAEGNGWLIALAIVGVVTSAISAFYYIRIPLLMYFRDGEGDAITPPALTWALGIAAVLTLLLGILPGPVMTLARDALIAVVG